MLSRLVPRLLAPSTLLKVLPRRPLVPQRGFIRVIEQSTVGYRQFLGRNRVKLEPGLRIKIPFVHQLDIVDLRERHIHIRDLKATTADNVAVMVVGTLFFQVHDPAKALYAVDNYVDSIQFVGTSAMRSIIGKQEYDKVNSSRVELNLALKLNVGDQIQKWGANCTRYEIQSVTPTQADINHILIKQMEAERERRKNDLDTIAAIRTAQGQRDRHILISEGELKAQENKAEGDFVMVKRAADAKAYSIEREAEATALLIAKMREALQTTDPHAVTQFLVEQSKLKHMAALADSSLSNNTYFFPEGSMVPGAKMMGDLLFPKPSPGSRSSSSTPPSHTQDAIRETNEADERFRDQVKAARRAALNEVWRPQSK